MKKFNKIFAFAMIALVGLSFAACSEDDLNTDPYNKSGVNLLAFGPAPAERLTEIRITGTQMQAVDKVIFPADATVSEAAVEKSAFNKVDAENIYVTIPDATVPGHIKLVAGKDTIVSEGTLTYKEPIEVTSVAPESGLNAGDVITIKGDYVYNIASVTFTNGVEVPAEEFVKTSRREITVMVPRAAESGTITFSDGKDWSLDWKNPIEVISPSVSSISKTSAEFGDEIEIKGVNLHTVESVMFAGGVSAEFTLVDNQTIKTNVPADCKSGAITLLVASGAAITSDEVAVPTISISGINQADDIIPGDVLTITGEEFSRVTGVQLPGIGDFKDYTIEGNTLTFTVPEEGFVDGAIVLVQNANISASIDVAVRKMANVVWMGSLDMGAWDGTKALQMVSWNPAYDTFMEAVSGPGVMTLGIETTSDNPQIKIVDASWANKFFENTNADGMLFPSADDKEISFEVTSADVAKIREGFVIFGCDYKLKYIKYVAAGAEQVLWEGKFDEGNWTNWEVGKATHGDGNPNMFSEANIQEGQVLRVYVEPKDAWWQIQFFDGHWGELTETGNDTGAGNDKNVNPNVYTLGEDNCIKFTLSKSTVEKLTTLNDWGIAWIIQCENLVVTKMTIAPL